MIYITQANEWIRTHHRAPVAVKALVVQVGLWINFNDLVVASTFVKICTNKSCSIRNIFYACSIVDDVVKMNSSKTKQCQPEQKASSNVW